MKLFNLTINGYKEENLSAGQVTTRLLSRVRFMGQEEGAKIELWRDR
jgi:hypothetical protein